MNFRVSATVILATLFLAVPAFSEPVPDRLIGKVNIRNSAKLDSQAKKAITAIAAKIKKIRPNGVVRITGDVPAADSQDEYISKAVFMSRNVEAQIKPLLSSRYQVYITAPKYSGEKRTGLNSVDIHLYPHELKAAGAGFISSQISSEPLPTVQDAPPSSFTTKPPSDSGLLTPAPPDDEQIEVSSKKERLRKETEDPALANELVNRAKARAAEKAKRLEQAK
jgi:hypothetical protein